MNEMDSYQAYAVTKDGTRLPVEAESIIIRMEDEEIEISLRPVHPVFKGKLTLAAGSAIQGREHERETATHLLIEPGAANVIHVTPKKYQ